MSVSVFIVPLAIWRWPLNYDRTHRYCALRSRLCDWQSVGLVILAIHFVLIFVMKARARDASRIALDVEWWQQTTPIDRHCLLTTHIWMVHGTHFRERERSIAKEAFVDVVDNGQYVGVWRAINNNEIITVDLYLLFVHYVSVTCRVFVILCRMRCDRWTVATRKQLNVVNNISGMNVANVVVKM